MTADENLNRMNERHNAIMAQSKKVQELTEQYIANSSARSEELIKAGKYQEAADLMSQMMDGLQAKNKIISEAHAQRADNIRKVLETPAPKNTKSILPEGIGKGRVAAVLAGVAVIGGGLLLYRQHQQKKRESWSSRIEQERMAPSRPGLSY